MKIAINQPYFFPYLGYFQLIASADLFVAYEAVDFTPKSWVTRNRLRGISGAIRYISLSVQKPRLATPIGEVALAPTARKEAEKLLQRTRSGYARAAHARTVLPWLAETLRTAPYTTLGAFNFHCLRATCTLLGLRTQLTRQVPGADRLEDELRTRWADLPDERRHRRVSELAEKFGATAYHNLSGGQELYDPAIFRSAGLDLRFVAAPSVRYDQFGDDFTPYLSIIDTLLHRGVEATSRMVGDYRFAQAAVLHQ